LQTNPTDKINVKNEVAKEFADARMPAPLVPPVVENSETGPQRIPVTQKDEAMPLQEPVSQVNNTA
jgi:hypothetical protein